MPRNSLFLLFALAAPSLLFAQENARKPEPITVAPSDWPWWRGPERNGIAAEGQQPPLRWSETEHVLWKAEVPGRGHSSPTVVGNRVFLATADEAAEVQSVLCYDRGTGERLWATEVHRGGFDRKGNTKNTLASSTVACDGSRLFINFFNGGAIVTTALNLDGGRLWQTRVADFQPHQGFGSSPAVFGPNVFVTADSHAGGAVAALDRGTGKVVWTHSRPELPNYASPAVLRVAGRDQVLVPGCDLVSSFEPVTGERLWEVAGATTECVTTIVTDGERVFVSGGYPRNHTQALRGDGSGETAWEDGVRVYVPSMLVHDGHLYAVTDAGVAVCRRSDTGEEVWKSRLGGTFSASLVLCGGHLFATNESGKTFVFKASAEAFELVAENALGDEAFATPAICDDRIYMRVASRTEDVRQEMLYCLGTSR